MKILSGNLGFLSYPLPSPPKKSKDSGNEVSTISTSGRSKRDSTSHSCYSLRIQTIIELEKMSTIKQESKFSGFAEQSVKHIWSPLTQNVPALEMRLLHFHGEGIYGSILSMCKEFPWTLFSCLGSTPI